MNKRSLNKSIFKAFRESKGRFLSIVFLMMLGTLVLLGLKVTGPDINRNLDSYYKKLNVMDLAVISTYGISESDQEELNTLSDKAYVEYGYFCDVVIKETSTSFRIFSMPKNISKFELVAGDFPSKFGEVALSSIYGSEYKIGDTVSFSEEGVDGEKKLLKKHDFKVTGFVNSGEIISTDALGVSSSGTGNLSGFAVVMPDVFDSEVYTIARIRYDDLRKFRRSGDEYREELEKRQKELDKLISDNGKNRLNNIRQTASDKISEGQLDIDKGKKELSDGEEKLISAQNEIDRNRLKLKLSEKQILDKKRTLKKKENELKEAKKKLDVTKANLDEAANQLSKLEGSEESKQNEFNKAEERLRNLKVELDNIKTQLDHQLVEINTKKEGLAVLRSNLDVQKNDLINQGMDPNTSPSIAELENSISVKSAEIAQTESVYNEGMGKYQSSLAEYEKNYTGLQESKKAYSELDSRKRSYQNGLAQYKKGLSDYELGKKKYQDGVNQLSKAEKTIGAGLSKVNNAQVTLNKNKDDFNSKKTDAEKEILKAEADIDEAKKEIEELSLPTYTSYTHRTLPGGEGVQIATNTSEGITAVGNLFPIVLYLVAALVTFTTMVRFVNEERTNAGILKALGYSNSDVLKKFIIYGFVSGIIGTILGILLGTYALPYLLCSTLLANTTLPTTKLYFYLPITFLAFVLSLICTVLPAGYVAGKELRETASQLILPKPPSKGTKILLERFKFIWSRMGFISKVTARNIFRYKQRMLMTIFGVAGSVALLFAGLGIASSISGIQATQFGEIIQYDAIVSKDRYVHKSEQDDIDTLLSSDKIRGWIPIYTEKLNKDIAEIEDTQSITMMATDSKSFSPYINLRNRSSEYSLRLKDSGVIVSEKIAKLMNVREGDSFIVEDVDGRKYSMTVSGVAEMYAGHFIFMSNLYYEKVFEREMDENGYLISFKDKSTDSIRDISSKFMAMSGVKGVVQNTNTIAQVEAITESLTQVMIVLTVLSILLAVVILYNLNNINVSERTRELSTVKVLGFFDIEVSMYIYRETIILSLIGIIVGLIGGKLLHKIILDTVAPDGIMFRPNVDWYIYLIPVLSILLILAVLGFVVGRILKKVDMLEALKSAD